MDTLVLGPLMIAAGDAPEAAMASTPAEARSCANAPAAQKSPNVNSDRTRIVTPLYRSKDGIVKTDLKCSAQAVFPLNEVCLSPAVIVVRQVLGLEADVPFGFFLGRILVHK